MSSGGDCCFLWSFLVDCVRCVLVQTKEEEVEDAFSGLEARVCHGLLGTHLHLLKCEYERLA